MVGFDMSCGDVLRCQGSAESSAQAPVRAWRLVHGDRWRVACRGPTGVAAAGADAERQHGRFAATHL